MEAVGAAIGSALAGASAFMLAMAATGAAQARRARPRRPRRAREEAEGLLEQLGHWPPMARLGNLAPLVGPSERLRAALAARGASLTRRGCVAFSAVSLAGLALALAAAARSALGAAAGAALWLSWAALAVGRHERGRADEAARQMPEVLRSIAASLGAGKSLPQAIEHVGMSVGEPLGSEFLRASFEIKGGMPVEEAVASLCGRNGAPGMALLGTALQISQRTGSSLDELLSRTARMAQGSVALRRELEVKTSQARLSAKVVSLMPLLLVGALAAMSPEYREGLAQPAGRACLCAAALLDLAALAAVRSIMRRSMR